MADILFVTATGELALNQEVNGTMILATKLLQAGFNTRILRFAQIESNKKDYNTFIRDMTQKILEISPKCVSFYTLWPYYHIMLRIAREVKEKAPEIITILGGPQASATAEPSMKAMPFVDYVCTGEGENTVVPFFDAILSKNGQIDSIPGLYYRKNGEVVANNIEMPLCRLEEIPYWDERLLDYDFMQQPGLTEKEYFMPIDAGRGCPYSCTFCCTSQFWRRTYRLKSAERIISDIRHYMQYGIKSFWFSHDSFTANRKLVEEVCDRIIAEKLDVTWQCSSRIDCLSEELILKMKQAGMIHIEVGIETGSPRMQKLIKKNLNLDKARDMIKFLLKNKIYVHLFFIYGFPDETEQDLQQTLDMVLSLTDIGVQRADMFFCKFAPATAITEAHGEELILDPEIKILSRGMSFGYEEELPVISKNREMFPFFYHLDTPLRKEYQYLQLFAWLYEKLPNSVKHLRALYQGDDLRFYRDFCRKNPEVFHRDIDGIVRAIMDDGAVMMENVVDCFDIPYGEQLKALIRFDYNAYLVSKAKEDIQIRHTYDFRYVDFKLKLSLEKYAKGQTEILLEKKDGKMNMRILRIG